jgi:F420-dependent oxidoreductase-like protein
VKTAINAGYWGAAPPAGAADLFDAAERLGVDQVWTAEAWGSDAWTPLAWYGSRTTRVALGTAVSQLSARPPATLAMTAMTMDHLTGGRVMLGIGTSNPQVVEGWYGQPYPRPLERTREYIDILRKVIARGEPVTYDGKHYQLPLAGGTGLGKPLRSILHPYRTQIPVYLGAEGPKNVALAAEIADGWLPMFFSPAMNDFYGAALAEGFARRPLPGTGGRTRETFDVVGGPLAIIPDDDVEQAADRIRPSLALYIGGMGARTRNFHNEVFVRMGYEAEASAIQQAYLAGDKKGAIAAVPTRMVEDVALIGPWAKIAEELTRWRQTVLTTLMVNCDPAVLPEVLDTIGTSGPAGISRPGGPAVEPGNSPRPAALPPAFP